MLLQSDDIDIACVSEHWLSVSEINILYLHTYTLLDYFCRINYKHGGVAIYCKDTNDIKYESLTFLSKYCIEKHFEICGIQFVRNSLKFKLVNVYRSPEADINVFFAKLSDVLQILCKDSKADILICGDFNLDFLVPSHDRSKLIDILSCFNVQVMICEPTRITANSSTCIDYICSNSISNKTHFVSPNGLSDHCGVVTSISLPALEQTQRNDANVNVYHYVYDNNSYKVFLDKLTSETWLEVMCAPSVDDAFLRFQNTLLFYIETSFRRRKTSTQTTNSRKPWLTRGILISCNNLKTIYRKAVTTQKVEDFAFYKQYKCIYKKVIVTAKKIHNSKLISQSQNKSRTAWKIINDTTNRKNKAHHNTIIHNDATVDDPVEISNIFNEYFINVCDSTDPVSIQKHQITDNNISTMFVGSVNPEKVYTVISGLRSSGSTGMDGISTEVLKKSAHVIQYPLASLINWSLECGVFPNIFKTAKVVPVFKGGDSKQIVNYRPISILSNISKILEKIVFDMIFQFLNKNSILHSAQHGFIQGKSTLTAIVSFMSKIYKCINDNNKCIGLFMDLSKAFDLVNHDLLLQKLQYYGLRGVIHDWLSSYLTNRKQIVVLDHATSYEQHIKSGVPQGSILGPLLFILFINDLACTIDSDNLVLYADDTSYIGAHGNPACVRSHVQSVLDKFLVWFHNNGLRLNPDKTVFINFTPKRKESDYCHLLRVDGRSIRQVDATKFLGLYIENNVSWLTHIDNLCLRLSQICYAIYRLVDITTADVIKNYYYACFESRIRYGIAYWGSSTASIRAFRLQKRAIRTMVGVSQRCSCRDLFRQLGILPLPSLFIYEVLLLIRSMESELPRNRDFHSYPTREASNFAIPKHNRTTYENNPLYVGIKLYNKLNLPCKNLNISLFKRKLKNYLVDKCFYSMEEYFSEMR